MSISKIEVKIGEFSFNGEGNEGWLSGQLDKILDKAETIIALTPTVNVSPAPSGQHQAADFSASSSIAAKSLANFLKEKNATVVQTTKFLATAAWLEAKGRKRLTTSDVSLALKDASQTKLNNPSQNLDSNIKKGYCEKDGNQFFVTQEGKEILGAV
jgi:hypothetical protein